MFTIKGCSLIRGVHYERFHCTPNLNVSMSFVKAYLVYIFVRHSLFTSNSQLNFVKHDLYL